MKFTPRQHRLIKAQMAEWPDSRILTHEEMLREWVCKLPPYPLGEWMELQGTKPDVLRTDDFFYLNLYNSEKLRHDFEYVNRLLTVLAMILVNGQGQTVVFYECGEPDERGRRFRGARYGTKPEQYISGFPGGKL